MPVVLLVVGLVVLAVGLLLLTGSRPHPDLPAVVRASPPAPSPGTDPSPATCDWSAWVEADDGLRVQVRAPEGRPCCSYVLRVRDLDPVDPPVDDATESLVWHGGASRVGPRSATTPLERDVVGRRADAHVGEAQATLTLDRRTGTEVATVAAHHDDVGAEPADPAGAAAELWQRHLDELHGHGAHPAPSDGAHVVPVEVRRRVEAVLQVERGCATVPQPARAAVGCRARIEATTGGTARPVGALLAAWVQVGATTVVADRPVGDPSGLAGWHPVDVAPAPGVTVVGDASDASCSGEWEAHRPVPVDPDRVEVVVGTAVRLEIDQAGPGSTGTAQVHGSCTAGVHVRLGPAADDAAGCARCVPEVELVVGRATVRGARSDDAGSTDGVAIRFHGHTTRLLAPVPGSGSRSWTASPEDLAEGATQPATRAR